MHIRLATQEDLNSIIDICLAAFPDEENQQIVGLAKGLLSVKTTPSIKSLVAEIDNQVVGYVSLSPILFDSKLDISGYILAPLGVLPNRQSQGIGSTLIHEGKELLAKDGVDVLLVYGDPGYYEKFGFNDKTAQCFTPPYQLAYPFGWLSLSLNEKELKDCNMVFECVPPLMDSTLW